MSDKKNSIKKCSRRFNGMPGANNKQKRPKSEDKYTSQYNLDRSREKVNVTKSTRTKLLERPLHEQARALRILRKLGLERSKTYTR